MAWTDIIPIMVRSLIGDLAASPTYSDARIEQSIAVAASIVINEYPFSNDYIVDVSAPDISPDPTVTATYDPLAIALFALRSAAILSMNTYQTAVGAGIRVRDGDSEVDTTSGFKGYQDILKMGPQKAYDDLLKKAQFNRVVGKAVLSPASTEQYSYNPALFFNDIYRSFAY